MTITLGPALAGERRSAPGRARPHVAISVAMLVAIASMVGSSQSIPIPDALARLIPVAAIDARGRARLDSGAAWVGTVRAANREIAAYGAVRTRAESERLVEWTRQSKPVRSASYVQVGGRFSNPPQPEDLAVLVLDPGDIDDLGACRPRECHLKLNAAEIVRVRTAVVEAGRSWKPAAQEAFRDILLERARSYQSSGDLDAAPYDDRRTPVAPAEEFAVLLDGLGLERVYGAELAEYLRSYPRTPLAHVESFLAWSKESLGGGKPIISITHIAAVRKQSSGQPEVLIAAKQVYASHYLTGSLSLTAITEDADDGPRYLVYARRSRVDLLTGPFAPLLRRTMERRIRSEGPAFLDGLRTRLEDGLLEQMTTPATVSLTAP
jgi:hypothetical protein